MKRLILCALLCVSLAACGNKDEKKTAGAGVTKANLPAVAGQGEGVVCPTIDGTFQNDADPFVIKTKVENGRYSYSISEGMPFQMADGKPVRIEGDKPEESGAMIVTCDETSVTYIVGLDDGKNPVSMKFSPNGNDVDAELKGEDGKLIKILLKRK